MVSPLTVARSLEATATVRRCLVLTVLSLLLGLCGWRTRPAAQASTVAPRLAVVRQPAPMFERRQITAFSKTGVGKTGSAHIIPTCTSPPNEEIIDLPFKVPIRPSRPCDENPSQQRLNGTLTGTLTILRRRDTFRGWFTGKWSLISDAGRTLAQGEMSGTVGVGTHRPPATAQTCERCAARTHFEGQLTGKLLEVTEIREGEIRATLAGQGPLQPDVPSPRLRMVIEGIVISRCRE
jgi:hypothetical protein